MSPPKFIVSALKHRPVTFAEVLSQDHTIQTLRHSIERNRLANGYIFAGSRGTGKTTTARVFARAINCENRNGAEPCNTCDSCLASLRDNHPDIIEIDAASNGGVNEIRELRENARFTPAQSPFKIYIIDESHMMSHEANNALLKTLEEPPPHCKFIFATTELHKVPQTILSRCQRFTFRRIPTSVIRQHLLSILQSQSERDLKPSADLESILYQIARASEGVLRDALVLLDQVLAFCSDEPRLSEAQDVLGVIEFDRLDAFVGAMCDDDPGTILSLIEDAARQGRDMRLFLLEALRHLRILAVASIDKKHPDLEDLPEEERKVVLKRASNTALEQVLYITDQLWDAERRLGYASDARLVLEMSAIKAAKVSQAVRITDLLEKLASAPGGGTVTVSAPAPVTPAAPAIPTVTAEPPRREPPAPEPVPASPPVQDEPPQTESPPAAQKPQEPAAKEPPAPRDGLSDISWTNFLSVVEQKGGLLIGSLEGSRVEQMTSTLLQLSLPAHGAYAKKQLESPKNRKVMTELLKEVYGRQMRITYTLRDSSDDDEPSGPETQTKPAVNSRELMEKVQNDPVFARIMDEMGGQISMIRPE